MASTASCVGKLRDGSACRSVATDGAFCAFHARVSDEHGSVDTPRLKRRNARERIPVHVESDPLELVPRSPGAPGAVRPALAEIAAQEVETIRRVLLEAATSTTRESWATCRCPECGMGFRQEISVPDHGSRIKAVETLLREGLGRVGEAVVELPTLSSVADVKALSWDELNLVFATEFAPSIQAVVENGDEALRAELTKLDSDSRAILASVLAEVA